MAAQIKAEDVANWDSLSDIAASFETLGLKRKPNLGDDNDIVLQLADNEFMRLVEAGPGEHASDFKPKNLTQHTNLVTTNDFEDFAFITRVRTWDQEHGTIDYQKYSFSKDQFTGEGGEKRTVLEKLNNIEYGNPATIYDDLYDTRKIVKDFYNQFEALRTDLVQEVAGIPEGHGDAKQRYVQVLLDRMIFLYFIQEKRLLDHEPTYLRDKHDQFAEDGEDVYEAFYDPLFFDLLAEGTQDPKFGKLPYLNGGLFSRNPVEEEFPDAKLGETREATNELFDRILEFLSSWNWNVDERLDIVDPKNLSPEVLGHIFEQTVNQKEMGAYYTPEEITGFMARRTIHPYLLDQLNEKAGTSYEDLDEVFGLDAADGDSSEAAAVADGGVVTNQAPVDQVDQEHVETLYFDVLTETRVLDPAVGSGAFLLAAQEVLLDVYMQCLEFFQAKEDSEPWELTDPIKDELETIEERRGNATLYAKREIILNNLYGVDIDDGAVEICKLRLWLSMVADIEDDPDEVETLPNIDLNIRQGNSLVGQVDVEVEFDEDGNSSATDWIRKSQFNQIEEAIQKHKGARTSEKAREWREKADKRIEDARGDFDQLLKTEFQNAGFDSISDEEVREWSPFHWPLEFAEVYSDGGFDVIIGNPPWDMLYANRDDFFVRYDEKFRTYSSDEKDEVVDELLEDESITDEWEQYQEMMETRADYFTEGDTYELQSPVVGGRTMPTKNELSALFLERVYKLSRSGVRVSLLLPGTIYGGVMGKDLRTHLVENTDVENIIGFENQGIFEDIDDRYRFGILTFRYGGKTEQLRGIFNQHSTGVVRDIGDIAATITRDVLLRYSPEGRIFPAITSQREVDVLSKVVNQPSLSEDFDDRWTVAVLTKEIVESNDKDRFLNSPDDADYPVLGGKNMHQYEYDNSHNEALKPPKYWSRDLYDPPKSAKHRIREKKFNRGNLKSAIHDALGGEKSSKSQRKFVNDLLQEHRGEDLSEDDVLLDCTEYRIAIRDVTNSTNERTMIASVLPKDFVCLHTINTFKPYEINPKEEHLSENPLRSPYERRFTDKEMFVALGLINSIPYDFLMRTKVETHIIKRELLESQMPRLTDGDDWFHYIADRAARLNCYGEEFAEMRERLGGIDPATEMDERRELQAEIDAAAFHAYGLEPKEVEFVLDDFHRVEDPRIMDEEYFDMVFEKYDLLAEEGPHP